MKKLLISLVLLMTLCFASSEIYFFYSPGCSACATMEPKLDEVVLKNGHTELVKLDIHVNSSLLVELVNAHGLSMNEIGTPTTFVNDRAYVGYSPLKLGLIDKQITECNEIECSKVQDILSGNQTKKQEVSFWFVTINALADAVNPCEFAVLVLLLSTIIVSGNKKRVLLSGFAFSASIFLMYLLMGLTLITVIKSTGISTGLYSIIGFFAIVIGLLNIKDYIKPGMGGFLMEVPMKWRPKMKQIIQGTTSPIGAFFVGILISLFLTPCTGGPYIVISSLLAEKATFVTGLLWLLYYNLVFISPMIIITLLVYYGFSTPEKAEKFRQGKIRAMHLITGIIMILIGIYVILKGIGAL